MCISFCYSWNIRGRGQADDMGITSVSIGDSVFPGLLLALFAQA